MAAHLDVGEPCLFSIARERVRVSLTVHVQSSPAELLDRDKGLVHMGIFRHEIRAQMQREPLRVQNVRGRLGQI